MKGLAHLIHAIYAHVMVDVWSVVAKFERDLNMLTSSTESTLKFLVPAASLNLIHTTVCCPGFIAKVLEVSAWCCHKMYSSLLELDERLHVSSKTKGIGMIPFNEVVYAKARLTRETTNLHLDAQKTLQNKKLLMPSFDQLVNVKLSVSFQWCLVKAMSPFLLVIKEQAYISENMCWRVLHKALDEKVLNCKMMPRKQDKKKTS